MKKRRLNAKNKKLTPHQLQSIKGGPETSRGTVTTVEDADDDECKTFNLF